MNENKKTVDRLLESLEERAKELNCLYRIEELLNRDDAELEDTFSSVVEAIPPGWQYTEYSQVRITLEGAVYETSDFKETEWVHSSDIKVQERVVGTISVYYTQELPTADHGPFLKEELHLLDTIADRLGHFILHNRVKHVYQEWISTRDNRTDQKRGEWQVVLDLLEQTDKNLFTRLSHKMLNHLCWSGVEEAEELLKSSSFHKSSGDEEFRAESNRAYQKRNVVFPVDLSSEVFRIAGRNMTNDEIFSRLQKWIQEDKLGFLVNVVNRNLSLSDVADAIRRYYHTAQRSEEGGVSPAKIGIHVSLIRRFLSDQLHYINIAKKYIDINDFYKLLQNMIYTTESHGKLGGKSAGMFLAAQIIKKNRTIKELPGNIKIPRTWYITSDILLHFMHYNNLEEIVEQKYKQIDEVRFEYPHIVYTFKNSHFPSEIVKGLSVALDDFGDLPLIVRSSSLLEDRMGAAFSGKYKSVFLANQGSKQRRLDSLLDAVAEVYASTFGPDPVEYRTERGLIDFAEEMGIMIQEVV
ncbi:MAG: pyruvate, phosphate dikinase, partial [candidate division Zixibacteria bacterium]|nr:pyruvate, phosphate dikinase [candidate division Zixibacteria bacterium]